MSGGTGDLTEAEPLVIARDTDESGAACARFEAVVHPARDAGTDGGLYHERWLVDNPEEHVHPNQRERIVVLDGTYRVAVDGAEHTLTEGESVTVPEGAPHRHWNPTDRPIRVAHEHRPPMQVATHVETMYALAQAGRTNEEGLPNPLQFAVTTRALPGHAYTTTLPVRVQDALFALLAPVGRLLGYEAVHARADVDDLR